MASKTKSAQAKKAKKSPRSRPARKQPEKGHTVASALDAKHTAGEPRPAAPDSAPPTSGHVVDTAVAYAAGRALNCVRFHIEQTWLINSDQEIDAAHRAFDTLTRHARLIMPPRDRQAVEELVHAKRQLWMDDCNSEGLVDRLESWNSQLAGAYGMSADYDEACQSILSKATGIYGELRDRLRAAMDNTSLLAFELGELIDSGLRPREVWRYMRQQADPAGSDIYSPPPWFLPNHRVLAGELPQSSGWAARVKALCSELGIAVAEIDNTADDDNAKDIVVGEGVSAIVVDEDVDCLAAGELAKTVISMVNRMHALAYAGLQQLRASAASRLIIIDETQVVILDGQPFPIKHRMCFVFLKLLKKAEGKIVSREKLREQRVVAARLDKIIKKHIPKTLRRAVQSKRGKDGGYFILLPPIPGPE